MEISINKYESWMNTFGIRYYEVKLTGASKYFTEIISANFECSTIHPENQENLSFVSQNMIIG